MKDKDKQKTYRERLNEIICTGIYSKVTLDLNESLLEDAVSLISEVLDEVRLERVEIWDVNEKTGKLELNQLALPPECEGYNQAKSDLDAIRAEIKKGLK